MGSSEATRSMPTFDYGVYLHHNLEFYSFRIPIFLQNVHLYNSNQIIVIFTKNNLLYDGYLYRNWYVSEKMIFKGLQKIGNKSLIVLSLSGLSNDSLIDIY